MPRVPSPMPAAMFRDFSSLARAVQLTSRSVGPTWKLSRSLPWLLVCHTLTQPSPVHPSLPAQAPEPMTLHESCHLLAVACSHYLCAQTCISRVQRQCLHMAQPLRLNVMIANNSFLDRSQLSGIHTCNMAGYLCSQRCVWLPSALKQPASICAHSYKPAGRQKRLV